jgi:hypothetical protein
MMRIVKPAVAVAMFSTLIASSLDAAEINKGVPEGHAVTTELGKDTSIISYWMSTPEGWEVVTIVDTVSGRDTDAEHHAIVRFSTVLLPGETQVISAPAAIGEEQPALLIRRVGDGIEVVRVDGSSI